MWPFKSKPSTKAPPTPTPEMHEEARRNPNGWVYVIKGMSDPNGVVPPERIVGAWKVDAAGKITDEYTPNEKYRGPAI
jgi:hypothetical protein